LSAGAFAADLPSRRAAPPVFAAAPAFTWTGFYVGAQAGYGWGNDESKPVLGGIVVTDGVFGEYDTDGFVGGVHAGYNHQIGNFVLGLEGDIEAADLSGGRTLANPALPGISLSFGTSIDWQGSLRARAGFAADRALFYVTGGLAYANIANTYTVTAAGGNILGLTPGTYPVSFDDTQWGWTLGTGVEYAFTSNLTARVEYRYTRFDSFENRLVDVAGIGLEQEPDFHTARIGVSYKF
jgi:outer membrane immunogenic protein